MAVETVRELRRAPTVYRPPGVLVIENGSMPAGSTLETARAEGKTRERRVINLITPETQTSAHYFWAIARCNDIQDHDLTTFIRDEVQKTFDEDKVILEAQQRRLGDGAYDDGRFPVTLRADAGGARASPACTRPTGRLTIRRLVNRSVIVTGAAQDVGAAYAAPRRKALSCGAC